MDRSGRKLIAAGRVPPAGDVAVGDIWDATAGGVRARTLRVGERTWTFDEEGALQPDAGPQ